MLGSLLDGERLAPTVQVGASLRFWVTRAQRIALFPRKLMLAAAAPEA